MKKYPVGIQSFESLRKGGYLYIDKTELIYRLVSTGKYYFFLFIKWKKTGILILFYILT